MILSVGEEVLNTTRILCSEILAQEIVRKIIDRCGVFPCSV